MLCENEKSAITPFSESGLCRETVTLITEDTRVFQYVC